MARSIMGPMALDGRLAAGRSALADGRWDEAEAAFTAVLEVDEDPEALDGLADARWWRCDALASVAYRERAWVAHRRAGHDAQAGRAALDLCIANLVNIGSAPAAAGWLARAERVTRTLDPNPLQGWLWLLQGLLAPEREAGRGLLARALGHAGATGDVDLELVALSDLGLAHLTDGDVDTGLSLLDEALAGTLAGEWTRPDTVVFAMCNMLAACHAVGDLDRATRWCAEAEAFMARFGCPFLYARCRVHYGGVLVAKGRWQQAEAQLRAAIEMAEDAGPATRADALGQLADLRVRQGRVEEAEALLAMVDEPDSVALASATVRLARGEPGVAAGLLERRAASLDDDHIDTPGTLALLVDAALAEGTAAVAAAASERLGRVAAAQGRKAAGALAGRAAAHVAAAGGRSDEAVAHLERALAGFADLDLPLEAARCRHELAQLLQADRPALAAEEATRALTAFRRLGAVADADATSLLLRQLGVATPPGPRSPGLLTAREQEVLHLVALGLSNPEIADRLHITRKTAAHHVSRVLTKLGLRNRTEAAAYAVREG
jgi:DNA-binding CsgD family transcriptional regulator